MEERSGSLKTCRATASLSEFTESAPNSLPESWTELEPGHYLPGGVSAMLKALTP